MAYNDLFIGFKEGMFINAHDGNTNELMICYHYYKNPDPKKFGDRTFFIKITTSNVDKMEVSGVVMPINAQGNKSSLCLSNPQDKKLVPMNIIKNAPEEDFYVRFNASYVRVTEKSIKDVCDFLKKLDEKKDIIAKNDDEQAKKMSTRKSPNQIKAILNV